MSLQPEKPSFVFAVGVVGHRLNKLEAGQIGRIRRQLGAVFAAIDAACADACAAGDRFYSGAGHHVRLVCGLAEGSDQLAVAIRPEGWSVDAVLAFPRARFAEDFRPGQATGGLDRRAEFEAALAEARTVVELPDEGGGAAAYERAGHFILRQSDLLVAVWDGEPRAGPGGTEANIDHAIANGIPVIWIRSDRDEAPLLLTGAAPRDDEPERALADDTAILRIVHALTVLPASTGPHHGAEGHHGPSAGAAERAADFLAEPWRTRCRSVAFDCLKRFPRFWTWRLAIPLQSLAEYRAEWAAFAASAPGGAFAERIAGLLATRYAWADSLATHFSHVYRSAYVLTYVLSALAVAVALLDVLPIVPAETDVLLGLGYKAILAAVELAIVALIMLLVRRGRKGRWHERWLDYRALAELLRHARFLALAGEATAILRSSAAAAGPEHAKWLLWYLRATCRELGTGEGVVDAAYQRRILHLVERHEIDGQIAYHHGNRRNLSALDERLHHLGNGCFLLTALLLAAYLLAYFLIPGVSPLFGVRGGGGMEALHGLVPWITFLDALLPALGASVAGIRFTGDFEGFAKRSADTADALTVLKRDYVTAIADPRLERTSAALIATAAVLVEDISGWESLYSRKRLVLPA